MCIYWDMLLNVQLRCHRSTLKQIVRSVLHLRGYIFCVTRELVTFRSNAVLLMLLAMLRIRSQVHRVWALSLNKILPFICGLELIQGHNSKRLHLSAGSRCWMFLMWYRYITSVCNVHQTLRVEVSTSGLNSRANSESEMSYCIYICVYVCMYVCIYIYIHDSDLQWFLSLEQLKCSGCVLSGRTHVTRPVVLQIGNRAIISYCDNCAVSSNCKHVIFLWRMCCYAFCVWGWQW